VKVDVGHGNGYRISIAIREREKNWKGIIKEKKKNSFKNK